MLFTERRANHGVWPIEIDHHRGSRDMNEERKFIIDGQEVHAEVERSGNTLKIKIEGELHEVSLNETQRVSKANFKGRSAKRRTNQSTGQLSPQYLARLFLSMSTSGTLLLLDKPF